MKNLYAALLKAQGEFPPVPKDGRNTHLNSRYATLGSVQETAFPVLSKHGLLVMQSVRTEWAERGPIVCVGAALVHVESGELVQQELALLPAKTDPQGIGSAISYGRRYLLLTMLGLNADDDDATAAGAQTTQRPAQASPPARNAQPQRQPAPPPAENEIDVSQRPRWKTSVEAKEWARSFNVFKAPAHLNNAYLQACERGGLIKDQTPTPEIMERSFDEWFADVMRRAAEREPAKNGN